MNEKLTFASSEAKERFVHLVKVATDEDTIGDLLRRLGHLTGWPDNPEAMRPRRLFLYWPGGKTDAEPYIEWAWQERDRHNEWRTAMNGGLLGRDREWSIHT